MYILIHVQTVHNNNYIVQLRVAEHPYMHKNMTQSRKTQNKLPYLIFLLKTIL